MEQVVGSLLESVRWRTKYAIPAKRKIVTKRTFPAIPSSLPVASWRGSINCGRMDSQHQGDHVGQEPPEAALMLRTISAPTTPNRPNRITTSDGTKPPSMTVIARFSTI